MDILYLGHAGFLVETPDCIIVMDPWLSAEGAFDSSWYQLPRNHHLAPVVRDTLENTAKPGYVYVSHEHRDHFDLAFLSTLPSNVTYLTPVYRRTALADSLGKLPSRGVVTLPDGGRFTAGRTTAHFFVEDGELDRDSAILVADTAHSFLNLNDANIFDRLPDILRDRPRLDVFTCQFSGASWHPTCYDFPPDKIRRIAGEKKSAKFRQVAGVIRSVNPRLYVPSAGPPAFLDPDLFHVNFEPCGIFFPRAPEFVRYLDRVIADTPVGRGTLLPGDRIALTAGRAPAIAHHHPALEEHAYDAYIADYAQSHRAHFAALRRLPADVDRLRDRLRRVLQRKLDALTVRLRIDAPLYFGIVGHPDRLLRVDFKAGRVTTVAEVLETDHYHVAVPAWELQRLLDEEILWEDLMHTMRVRLRRSPDLYQTAINGFLTMQPEDVPHFCERLLDAEGRTERITVCAGGVEYSVDRYCPHMAGDLAQGRIEGERYLVCPRHRWRFDLAAGGRSTSSEDSIHAIEVD